MGTLIALDHTHSYSRLINASPSRLYQAFLDPDSLVHWLPPRGAKAVIEDFNPVMEGRFKITLTFDRDIGKSSMKSDVVVGCFLKLVPNKQITQAIEFESDRPEFRGTMTMNWSFQQSGEGTLVSVIAENVPTGIDRADHERGMASSLENLAGYVAKDIDR